MVPWGELSHNRSLPALGHYRSPTVAAAAAAASISGGATETAGVVPRPVDFSLHVGLL